MRSVFLLLLFFVSTAKAHTYYFSATTGSDARTSNQAQHPATPWKSLDKLNSYFNNFSPGDSILLKRGDEFYGTINITRSGSKNLPIIISAFGAGPKPIVSGFSTIKTWNDLGSGIWESTSPVTNLSSLNMVVIGQEIQQIGRYPNADSPDKGYLKISSHLGKNSITDVNLKATPNWNGGDIVVRTSQYTIDRAKIISHTESVINFDNGMTYEPKEGYGYFIQNHPATLDQVGEWYLNPQSKKLQIYYGRNSPPSVNVAINNTLVNASGISYIILDNIDFTGANENNISIKGPGSDFSVQNCDISFSGISGLTSKGETSLIVQGCNVDNALNEGISVTDNSVVRNCVVSNTGFIAGMTQNNAGASAINNSGSGSTTEKNIIKNTGYIGIKFGRMNSLVKNNFVDSFCTIKQDGGGIYAQGKKTEVYSGTQIIGNIVTNGLGAPEGTSTTNNNSIGIYIDDFLNNIDIEGNTVANSGVGIYLHNNKNITMINNTSFNNSRTQFQISSDKKDYPVSAISMNSNIFFAKLSNQMVSALTSLDNNFEQFGSMNNNVYTRPVSESGNLFQKKIGKQASSYYTLEKSQLAYPSLEKGSKKAPLSVDDVSRIKFNYNPTLDNKTVDLDGKYVDVNNTKYSGKIILKPFTSLILIKSN